MVWADIANLKTNILCEIYSARSFPDIYELEPYTHTQTKGFECQTKDDAINDILIYVHAAFSIALPFEWCRACVNNTD